MSCCGEKRAGLAAAYRPPALARGTSSSSRSSIAPPATGTEDVLLTCLRDEPVRVHGPRSGRAYEFVDAGTPVGVHPSDVQALLATRLFVTAS